MTGFTPARVHDISERTIVAALTIIIGAIITPLAKIASTKETYLRLFK